MYNMVQNVKTSLQKFTVGSNILCLTPWILFHLIAFGFFTQSVDSELAVLAVVMASHMKHMNVTADNIGIILANL
jgi:hypothetical protein